MNLQTDLQSSRKSIENGQRFHNLFASKKRNKKLNKLNRPDEPNKPKRPERLDKAGELK